MKKYYSIIFAFLLGVFVFFPSIKVNAETLSEIRFYSDTTEVSAGTLPEFSVSTTTSHATIETYGSNTGWAHWEQGYQSWHGFGTDVPTATLNPNAHWGMRLAVHLDSGYEFDENTKIIFNDEDVTGQGHNIINYATFDWGGYVYIDLGNVDIGEPIYTVSYDYNGGTKNGRGSETFYWVSYAMEGTLENFMDGVTAPDGKVLDYVLVNGERMDFPFPFEINKDYTIKYMWKNPIVPITQLRLTGVPYLIVGKKANTSTIKIVTEGYENAKFEWIEESTNKVMSSEDTIKAGEHYILRVYDFNAIDGYSLPESLDQTNIISNITALQAEYKSDTNEARLSFNSVTQVKRKITFNPNGGSVKPTYKYVYTYSTYSTLPKPTRRGYTFLGWYTAKTGGVKVVNTTQTNNTGNRTLYARWTITKYKLTYYLNGGTNNKSNPLTYTMNTKTFYFKNPSRKGYLFKGWYKDSKYKTKITYIKKGTIGNRSVYAKWSPIKYSIAYNRNGGTGTMSKSTGLVYNKTYTLRANAFKKKGYSFNGWNKKADGSSTKFANKAKVKNLTSKNGATVTLYAQWKKTNYKITYNMNGGTNNSSNPATYTISSSVTFKNPSKKGYTFKGWYTDSKFKNRITSISKGSTGNKTVYAKWVLTTYKINYETNGGQNRGVYTPYTYTIKDEVWLSDCDREGYLFVGWYLDEELTNKIEVIPEGTDHNVTLYAKWVDDTEENSALLFAEEFLKWYPYSRDRLIWYLQYYEPHYSLEAATYAADNVGVDWYEMAVREAQRMLALDDWSFSHDGLVEFLQNDSELFTEEQAIFAANNCGVTDWKVYAVKEAKILAKHTTYSRSLMIENLISQHLFSEEDAIYGVNNADINFADRALEAARNHINAVGSTTRELLIEYLVNTLKFEQEEAEAAADTLL